MVIARLRLLCASGTAFVLAILLTACGASVPQSELTPFVSGGSTPATLAPTAVSTMALIPTLAAPQSIITDTLVATVASGLPPNTADAVPGGEQRIHSLLLRGSTSERPLWVVFSTGAAAGTFQHFVAIYTRNANAWVELGRLPLSNPTILRDNSVVQEAILPGRFWIGVRGDSGLVGPCCYDLLSFDGTTLKSELSVSERSLTSVVTRIGANNTPEIVIAVQPSGGVNSTPAPSVEQVYYWNGQKMVQR